MVEVAEEMRWLREKLHSTGGMRTRDDTTSSGVLERESDALRGWRLSNRKSTDGCRSGVVVGWDGMTIAVREEALLWSFVVLDGEKSDFKNQHHRQGKAWTAAAWTDGSLLAASVTNEAS